MVGGSGATKKKRTVRRKPRMAGSGDALIAEKDFLPLFVERARSLVELCAAVTSPKGSLAISRRVAAGLDDRAHDVETFLDDHDARGNSTFAAITEFVACLRGFAAFGRTLEHVASRFEAYDRQATSTLDAAFLKEVDRTRAFADRSLRKLARALLREIAAVGGGTVRANGRNRAEPGDRGARRRLPYDVGELAAMNEHQKIAEIAASFITHARTLGKLYDGARFADPGAMRRYVLDVSDEEQCRYLETKIHNVESRYDTFIKSTDAESADPDLKRFRGVVAIALHLIESMTHLVHFYERHENEIRSEPVKDRVADLIDKDEVLDRALNFCLYYAHAYMEEGLPLSERLVKRYTRQERVALDLPGGVLLHIRPASLIAGVVKHHGTPVHVTIGGNTKYAGSVLDILMLAGMSAGERRIVFEGDRSPLEDLRELFAHRIGEDGLAGLPERLAYLRPGS